MPIPKYNPQPYKFSSYFLTHFFCPTALALDRDPFLVQQRWEGGVTADQEITGWTVFFGNMSKIRSLRAL